MSALRLLRPRSLAFIGGGVAPFARDVALASAFAGPIHAVHPTRPGALRSIADLPEPPDCAFVAVNAAATVEVVRELAAIGAGGAICYAAGFAEAGDAEREAALLDAAGGMALLGPNCYGLLDLVGDARPWPAPCPLPRVARGVALVMQSGNLAINVTFASRSLPIAFVVSVGNQAGLDAADCVRALADQPEVTGIGLYLEGLKDPAAFADAVAVAQARGVPVAAVKVGRSEMGARVAATHTSSLAGSDELYDAFFDRLGVARVPDAPALVETLKAMTALGPLAGRRAVVFTCSGGESALAADAAADAGLRLDPPAPEAAAAIAAELPWYAGVGNPLDYNTALWGQEEALTRVFGTALADAADVALLVVDHPPSLPEVSPAIDAAVAALRCAAADAGVPAAVASTMPESFPDDRRTALYADGIAPLQGVPDAIAALGACARWGERRRDPSPVALRAPARAAPLLDEHASKELLRGAGVRVPAGRLVAPDEAPAAAAALGFPVVAKLCSPALAHKAAAGAVALGLADEAAVATAGAARRGPNPGLALAGVLVEELVAGAVAELLVGIKQDPVFGAVVVVGAGGGLVELIADTHALLPPFRRRDVEEALRRLRIWPLVRRGDVPATVDAVLAVASLVGTVAELDVNPLLVLPDGCVAADALIARID